MRPAGSWIGICLLLLTLALSGCGSPAQLAQTLCGHWESGKSHLVFTPHGLYGLRHESHSSAGRFGVPATGQLVVEEAAETYSVKSLWKVKLTDSEHLSVTFADDSKIEFTRVKAGAANPELTGLWQAPTGTTRRNFYEFNSDGSYVSMHWGRMRGSKSRKLHRRAEIGSVRSEKGVLHLDRQADESRPLSYTLDGNTLLLKRPGHKTAVSYQRVLEPFLRSD